MNLSFLEKKDRKSHPVSFCIYDEKTFCQLQLSNRQLDMSGPSQQYVPTTQPQPSTTW
jgi:hypothetical protein